MISFLGYLNIALLIFLLFPFLLRRINKVFYNNKNKILRKATTYFSKAHPYFGLLLLIFAFIHGYLALGSIRLHTGPILWIWILFQVMLGISAKKMRKPLLFKIHKIVGIMSLIILVAHLIQI